VDDFGRWLRGEIERRHGTQAAFARAAGVREQLVSQWVSGKDLPSMPNVMAIARGLRLDYRVVAREAGIALPDEPPPRTVDDILEELRETAPLPVPIVQNLMASAGAGGPVEEYQYLPPAFRRGRRKNILGVIARGECMEPEIRPGDYIIFDEDATREDGDIVVAVADGEVLVKRLATRNGRSVLRADADGRTIPIDESVHIVGRVIFITRPK
jgi:SOS-response transcriptional repressor LexA